VLIPIVPPAIPPANYKKPLTVLMLVSIIKSDKSNFSLSLITTLIIYPAASPKEAIHNTFLYIYFWLRVS
jgi:hypothetical protein